ncbi:RibD family protein [Micromonospora chersina]|uniref:RibD family protein n=1 Tax=Micromonospora chersina TaxID=47854 RepID=UPI003715F182
MTAPEIATSDRPYILLSCATSIDGYLDDASDQRLMLSNEADLDRVDDVRAGCDAILVGAGTVRRDNPRLLIRSPRRRQERTARGLTASPLRVTVTSTGNLDPHSALFTTGDNDRIVYCANPTIDQTRDRLTGLATVVDGGDPVRPSRVVADLARRGVRRIMVEGGAQILTQFLAAGLADELHVAVAPFFVGDQRAPRFAGDGCFPWRPGRRATVAEVRQIGDIVLTRYALSHRCPG